MVSPSRSIQLNIVNNLGRIVDKIEINPNCSVASLKDAILHTKVALRANRQKLSLPSTHSTGKGKQPVVLEDEKSLESYQLKDGATIMVKDLGPQISWRTVFCIEYLGPLLIHQLFFLYRLNTSTSKTALSFVQILGYVCVSFHFLKREYETFFIHRFSHATMPLKNLFKNCGHYWILSGFLLAFTLYRPVNFVSPSMIVVLFSLAIFIAAELCNFYTHAVLRSLRPEGSTKRAIPKGFGFDLVSCPNYTFEIVAWIAFALMTGLWSAWLFVAVASVQMYLWAVKKHKRYRQEFPEYPRSRKALIPYLC